MKIVKTLKDSETWAKEFTCRECQTVVEIEQADLHVSEPTGSKKQPRVQFTCPVCKSEVVVTRKIPSGIKRVVILLDESKRSGAGN